MSVSLPSANAAPAGYSADGMAVSASPAKIRPNKNAAFTLSMKDANSSGAPLDTYYLYDLPADWTVLDNNVTMIPSSPDPVIYSIPAKDLQTNKIQLKPPANYLGNLTVSLGRQMGSPNLITDFDGGSFDYVGQSKPTLPAANTQYAYHDPTTLFSNGTTCQSDQYGPCDGQYSIWPTSDINGPAAQHLNNHWADLRSLTNAMPATPANSQYSTSNICQNWNVAGPGGSNWSQNFLGVNPADAAQYGKVAVFNGSTTMASPNNLLTTTVTGLNPDQPYLATMNVANLSDDKANTLLPQTALYVQTAAGQTGTVIGTTQPLANQSACDQAQWSVDTGIATASASGTLTVSARNYAAGGNGNDVAIDGLAVYPMAVVPLDLGVSLDNPALTVAKTSSPASGSSVTAGQTVTYTVTASNTGDTPLDPVTLTDDLSGVLAKATLAGTPTASQSPAPTVTGNTLTWTGSLDVGATVTMTYKVVINAGVTKADTMTNKIIGTGTDVNDGSTPAASNCVTGTEPGCFSTLTGATSVLTVGKTSDPPTGSIVTPGQTVSYTLTATNDGDVVYAAELSDDLTHVLDNATMIGSPTSDFGDAPTISGDSLTWNGSVPVGRTVTVKYDVKVNADAPKGAVLHNEVTGGDCTTNCVTDATVGEASLNVTKVSDPPTGSTVTPGQTVTYTVTATNTGDVVLNPVTVADDLSDVLRNATLVQGSLVTVTGWPAATLDGSTVNWSGSLQPGQVTTITYQVIVNADATAGQALGNLVVASATDPDNPDEPPAINCAVGSTDPGCSSTLPVGNVGLDITKTSTPPSGSVVTSKQTITYTLHAVNSGDVDLTGVTLTDDLSDVLAHGTLVDGSLTTTAGSLPVIDGTTLAWTGDVAAHADVTITYQVKLDDGLTKPTVIVNKVTGSGTNPGNPDQPGVPSNCVTGDEPGCSSALPVGDPFVTVTKKSDPPSGSEVSANELVTYTLTATNTGDVNADPVTLSDDLANVLTHATVVGAPTSSQGPAPKVTGSTVTWTGPLGVGQTVVVTYQVRAASVITPAMTIVNSVKASAHNPDNPDGDVPTSCDQGNESGCSSILKGDPPAGPAPLVVSTGGVIAPVAASQMALMAIVFACLAGATFLLRRALVGR